MRCQFLPARTVKSPLLAQRQGQQHVRTSREAPPLHAPHEILAVLLTELYAHLPGKAQEPLLAQVLAAATVVRLAAMPVAMRCVAALGL